MRSESLLARAVLLHCKGTDFFTPLVEKLQQMYPATSSAQPEPVILTPLRITVTIEPLHSQPSQSSTPPPPLLEFPPYHLGYRCGVGDIHQGNFRYAQNIGKQCTAMAAVACAFSYVRHPDQWTKQDLHDILDTGDAYYSSCAIKFHRVGNYLGGAEIEGSITFKSGETFLLKPDNQHSAGANLSYPNPTLPAFMYLSPCLAQLTQYQCILMLTKDYATAIINSQSKTYIFDSHSRDAYGMFTPSGGCCLLEFFRQTRFDDLEQYMLRLHSVSPGQKFDVDLTVVTITPRNPVLSPVLNPSHTICPVQRDLPHSHETLPTYRCNPCVSEFWRANRIGCAAV